MDRKYAFLLTTCLIAGIAFPRKQEAQRTTTRCYEMLGEVRCRTSTNANWADVIAAAAKGMQEMDEAERRLQLETEQRRLVAEQLRQAQAAEAAKAVLDEETRIRREAQQRLYWARATNTLVEVSDSLDFDNESRKVLTAKSRSILDDLFAVNPQAASAEILDNLRPVVNDILRINTAFDNALISWVKNNLTFVKSLSRQERDFIEKEVREAKGVVAAHQSVARVQQELLPRLDEEKRNIVANRESCLKADYCYLDWLAPTLRKSVDSVRAIAEKRASAKAKADEARRAASERAAAAKSASLTKQRLNDIRLLISELPRYPQFTALDSVMRLRFERRLRIVAGEEPLERPLSKSDVIRGVHALMQIQTDWCSGAVSCDSSLVSDSLFTAFLSRRALREESSRNAATLAQRIEECFREPLKCKKGEIPADRRSAFSEKWSEAMHPIALRVPSSLGASLFGPDTAIEWSARGGTARVRVARKSTVWKFDGSPATLIAWAYSFNDRRNTQYQRELIEFLVDPRTLALLEFKHAAVARGGEYQTETPFTYCMATKRNSPRWEISSIDTARTAFGERLFSPAVPFVLAHLSWPTPDTYQLRWEELSRVFASPGNIKFYLAWTGVGDYSAPPTFVLERAGYGKAQPKGGYLLSPSGWRERFGNETGRREFDQWDSEVPIQECMNK